MNKLRQSPFARTLAFFIAFLSAATLLASCTALITNDICLSESGKNLFETARESITYSESFEIAQAVSRHADKYEKEILTRVNENSNLYFKAEDSLGNVLYENTLPENYSYKRTDTFKLGSDNEAEQITITAILKDPLTARDQFYLGLPIFKYVSENTGAIAVYAVISTIVFLFLSIFLVRSAGTNAGGEARQSFIDYIPFDLFLAIMGSIVFGCFYVFSPVASFCIDRASYAICIISALLLSFGVYAPVMATLMSASVRIKTKTLFSNNIITYALKLTRAALILCFKLAKKLFSSLGYAIGSLPKVFRATVVVLIFTVFEFILIAAERGEMVGLWLVLRGVMIIPIIIAVSNMHEIAQKTAEIKNGATDAKINKSHMFKVFRSHAENIEHIGDGLTAALAEEIKAERFKTELIANVSHDIKTPLTSIINYVDLLGKPDITKEERSEYTEILKKHALRLKKLTEDVIEASKAESGTINVEKTETDLNVMLYQVAAEYEEKFTGAGISLVIQTADNIPKLMLDGRLISRTLTNLFSNCAKYSLENSRVYAKTEADESFVTLSLKNTSKEPLNIDAQELMQRFVRGEESRTTEGSGLGLSIAQSFTELCGGKLNIEIDADLFTVRLIFPIGAN